MAKVKTKELAAVETVSARTEAAKLVAKLERLGMTPTQIAAEVNVNYFTVLRWLKGKTREPQPLQHKSLRDLVERRQAEKKETK